MICDLASEPFTVLPGKFAEPPNLFTISFVASVILIFPFNGGLYRRASFYMMQPFKIAGVAARYCVKKRLLYL